MTKPSAAKVALASGGALLAAAAFVPVPFVVTGPGPVFNTLGSVGGTPVIAVSGHKKYPTAGSLNITTVSERGGTTGGVFVGEGLLALLSSQKTVQPREALFPPGESGQDASVRQAADFSSSQSDAIGAALQELGIPAVKSVAIARVLPQGPSDGKLQAGDLIVAADSEKVSEPEQLSKIVVALPVGATVGLSISRAASDGRRVAKEVQVATGSNQGRTYLGVELATLHAAPFQLDLKLPDVGGPSGGSMFALGIIDTLTPGYLNGGKSVAGTGTIAPDGTIGPIGGIEHKLIGARQAGAELFLAPRSNCGSVAGRIPSGLAVAAVSTLHEARAALASWVAGGPVPQCPASP
jgi:Lon-like protease